MAKNSTRRYTQAEVQSMVRFIKHYDRWAVTDGWLTREFHEMVEARESVACVPFTPERTRHDDRAGAWRKQ